MCNNVFPLEGGRTLLEHINVVEAQSSELEIGLARPSVMDATWAVTRRDHITSISRVQFRAGAKKFQIEFDLRLVTCVIQQPRIFTAISSVS